MTLANINNILLVGKVEIALALRDALPTDPYVLKDAEGLGPPAFDVNMSDNPNGGGIYYSRRAQPRHIVLKIGLNPNYAAGGIISDLRRDLYKLISPGYRNTVTINLRDNTYIEALTEGVIRSFEIAPFSREPLVQIAIDCESPFFRHGWIQEVSGLSPSQFDVENTGTAATGLYMQFMLSANMSSFSIKSVDPSVFGDVLLKVEGDFLANDTIVFNTEPGNRYITLYRSGFFPANLIHTLTPESTWFLLNSGVNTFIPSTTSISGIIIRHTRLYWGL